MNKDRQKRMNCNHYNYSNFNYNKSNYQNELESSEGESDSSFIGPFIRNKYI